jgi:two-component system, cell cycle sensor histidine kinase and response regulator CckA
VIDPTSKASAQPEPGRRRILIAEDDELVRVLIERLLATQGWEVVSAADGQEAVAAWEAQGEFDMVILDVRMPHMNGFEAYRRMCQSASHRRFLFVSGYSDDTSESRLVLEEGLPFLAKPFDADAFLDQVAAMLA